MTSLRSRVIWLVVGVATLATVLSAWLVSRSAEDALREQQAASLESAVRIYQALADFGATHSDWAEVGPLVAELAAEHDTRVALLDDAGTTIADSDTSGAGDEPRSLPERFTLLDPLVPVVYFGGGQDSIEPIRSDVEAMPYAHPAAERACLRERGFTPRGRHVIRTVEGGPEARQAVAECREQAQRAAMAPQVRLYLGTDASLAGPLGIAWQRTVLIAAAILALAAGIGWWLGRRLTGPLTELSGVAQRLAGGELDRRSVSTGGDEVGRVGRAFNDMADSLQRNADQRNRLISDVAHELGNPLTTLGGTLEAIEDGIHAPTPQVLASMSEEVDHLSRLVRDLGDLARADAGAMVLEVAPVDLAALAHSVVAAAAPAAVGVTLSVTGAAYVAGDARRLRQVLTNLVANAVRHTPPGGAVTLDVRRDAAAAVVEVADTGEGIAPDALGSVFDRFWRADSARSRDSGGTGLGLAICREIAVAHGGTLTVTSVPGVGSTFTLTLPDRPGSR